MKHSMEDPLTDIKPGKGEPKDSQPVGPSKILKDGRLVAPEYSDDDSDDFTQADADFIDDDVFPNTGTQRTLASQLDHEETHRTMPWIRTYSSSSIHQPPDITTHPSQGSRSI